MHDWEQNPGKGAAGGAEAARVSAQNKQSIKADVAMIWKKIITLSP
jgi:hypothetical protein